jgi:hypothetical protein
MATTTNYGWTTPNDTDLVKDGAAAIRTLGSSVDTTTKALNPSTTLGDIEYRSSTANTNTRLPIGTNGQYLTVSGGVPAWAGISAGGMTLISTTTLTGASVTLSSIPSTYKNLQLIIRNFRPSVDGELIKARINSDSGTNYNLQPYTSTSLTNLSFNVDEILITTGGDSSTSQTFAVVDFYDYANTATWKIVNSLAINNQETTPTNFDFRKQTALWGQTSAISSLLLYPASGNFTSGTALLYGVS